MNCWNCSADNPHAGRYCFVCGSDLENNPSEKMATTKKQSAHEEGGLKPSQTIIVERLANGFIVRPLLMGNQQPIPAHFLVFNDLGVAEPDGLSRESALTCFIQKHFSEESSHG